MRTVNLPLSRAERSIEHTDLARRHSPEWINTSRRSVKSPCLILLIGVAGSGKTTLAKRILRELQAVYLDNNHIADAFFPEARHGKRYEKMRPHFYQALYAIAQANLELGSSVFLDVPHVKEAQAPEWWRFMKTVAKRTHSGLVLIRCACSEEVLRARLIARGEKRDRWKLAHWDEFLRAQPIRVDMPEPHLELDTENPVAQNARAAIRYIRRAAKYPFGNEA
jgi:predicted kinase